jgi:hypothetical protein
MDRHGRQIWSYPMTKFTYTILRSEPDLGVMEVRYDREGYDAILVSAPLPREGETLDEILRAYAPIAAWSAAGSAFQNVAVDTQGELPIPVDETAPDIAAQVRAERDARLMLTDWIYLPDVTPPSDMAAWEAYRQALRDVPQQDGFPDEVVWPEAPAI